MRWPLRSMNTEIADLRRVVVIGASGAGKTTFARELAQLLDAPHVQLDALYWAEHWTPVDKDVFLHRVTHHVAAEHWVVDGNYRSVRPVIWPRATAIVWLDYGFPRVFYRLFSRTVRRAWTQERLFGGNRESWRLSFANKESVIWWMLKTWHRHKRDFSELMQDPAYRYVRRIALRRPMSGAQFHQQMLGGGVDHA
jgi:adenylate kinase family enzyme